MEQHLSAEGHGVVVIVLVHILPRADSSNGIFDAQRLNQSILVGEIDIIRIRAHGQFGVEVEAYGLVADGRNRAIGITHGEPIGQRLDGELMTESCLIEEGEVNIVLVVERAVVGI